MRLTEHFFLEEFTRSTSAARAGIDNSLPAEYLPRVQKLAQALENLRQVVGGNPIIIRSGYRCPALNDMTPGSSKTSAHMLGYAADFVIVGIAPLEVCQFIRYTPSIPFDQVIYEYGSWCHLSVDPRFRRELWTKKAGKPYIEGIVA